MMESARRAAALAALVLMGACAAPKSDAAATTTVIVVRHAEKATGQGDDPELSAAGAERAMALGAALRDAGVDAVITTQWKRTAETALPTTTESGATPEAVRVVWDSVPSHAAAVAAAVHRHPGQVVLVVGHSNTVPDIVAALGARKPEPLCESEYDRMEIVTLEPDGDARLIESRYGVPTPDRAGCPSMQ